MVAWGGLTAPQNFLMEKLRTVVGVFFIFVPNRNADTSPLFPGPVSPSRLCPKDPGRS